MKHQPSAVLAAIVLLVMIGQAGCVQPVSFVSQPTPEATFEAIEPSPEPSATLKPSLTPIQVLQPTETQIPINRIWVSPAAPDRIQQAVMVQSQIQPIDVPGPQTLRLEPVEPQAGEVSLQSISWVYTLVAPFPTITDGYSFDNFLAAWNGVSSSLECSLIMDPPTYLALSTRLGQSASGSVREIPADQLLEVAWDEKNVCAVVPFENLTPRWKVLRLDGQSPYDRQLKINEYPLTIEFHLNGPEGSLDSFSLGQSAIDKLPFLPETNWNPEHLTVLIMTGVTALVRATAWKMDTQGILFPAETIGDILRDADLTHISNEVAFAPNCPPGDPGTESLRFCSRPEYLELLQSVGVDIIELTGNHMNDWGPENFLYTLDLYNEHGFKYFAGGRNMEEARKALLVEDHGNKLAFIGCNPAGPASDWATPDMAGSAPCDLDWEANEIRQLRADGYLPIATFQYSESYSFTPLPPQQRDFRIVSEAGAAIVSGSQAHYPQTFEFTGDNLIHYGLGNLFFDQMAPEINGVRITGTRWEFIDRHIFYEGKYIGTEIITAMLEDYARPRLMTPDERRALLTDVFSASGWE